MIEEKTIKLYKKVSHDKDILKHLNYLKKHHKETYEHSIRVGLLCIYLGFENHLQLKEVIALGYSGFLHDIGKLDIPFSILSKKGKLSKKEMQKIKEHPRKGFLRLKEKKFKSVREIVIAHHEFAINPYPRTFLDRRNKKRKEKRRHNKKTYYKLAQILSVADHYDALYNKRSYKEPLTCKEIKEIQIRALKEKFIGA